ncbi:accessory factor UbiK family protein [Salinicola endophyticus]|uniref:Ubiquinone biosynthesis accessory factor UbiK n=1 Tax=Salinicola endophyticus TaxID=1949083 RepID=A0ABY8FDY3_9GAMM|nr:MULTISPECIES: accessory factor UbiK family protein [Salinicola]WFF41012.1 accessory factor UbiK family protein [Salinicola endophyticus]
MSTHDRFERLAKQLGDKLQGASQAPGDIQRNVQGVLRGAMERMDIVSREDFDIMMDVLTRTRERVEALETQVAALENALHSERASQPDTAALAEDDTDGSRDGAQP